ncbi:hypothetical protein SeLEV6574_g05877 [Synchytrium endobioticum]|uniref:RRM domain-containing protein n=1 Tax=Synchytrium endobioticum TaxID=286115 RepID=A0A507CRX0_9FUNG|nr:hypothetical protein SeLEV6574_g05877 [Synchytrium endobioticum]
MSSSSNSIPPNNTLYVTSIRESVKKTELRRQLYNLFSQHGKVIDVVATRRNGMRGQAFIVFAQLTGASAALRGLQGFPFYDKPLKITYAKAKSKAIKMMEGIFVEVPPITKDTVTTKKSDGDSSRKRTREDEGESAEGGVNGESQANGGTSAAKRPRETSCRDGVEGAHEEMEMDLDEEDQQRTNDKASSIPPNRILFIQNLPQSVTDQMLAMLFSQYQGFKEIRMVPGKPGIAFVEYETEGNAVVARKELDKFKLTPTKEMMVEFAQRGGNK